MQFPLMLFPEQGGSRRSCWGGGGPKPAPGEPGHSAEQAEAAAPRVTPARPPHRSARRAGRGGRSRPLRVLVGSGFQALPPPVHQDPGDSHHGNGDSVLVSLHKCRPARQEQRWAAAEGPAAVSEPRARLWEAGRAGFHGGRARRTVTRCLLSPAGPWAQGHSYLCRALGARCWHRTPVCLTQSSEIEP